MSSDKYVLKISTWAYVIHGNKRKKEDPVCLIRIWDIAANFPGETRQVGEQFLDQRIYTILSAGANVVFSAWTGKVALD